MYLLILHIYLYAPIRCILAPFGATMYKATNVAILT